MSNIIYENDITKIIYENINNHTIITYENPKNTFKYLIKNTSTIKNGDKFQFVFTGENYYTCDNINILDINNFKDMIIILKRFSKLCEMFKHYNIDISSGIIYCNDKILKILGDIEFCSLSITTKENYKKQIYSNIYYDLETFEELFPEYFFNPVKLVNKNE